MKELKSLARGSSLTFGSASMVYFGIEKSKIFRLLSIINSQFLDNSTHVDMPWILDSGATDHITPNSSNFISYISSPSNRKL